MLSNFVLTKIKNTPTSSLTLKLTLLNDLIKSMEEELKNALYSSEYYHKLLKKEEKRIINLKENIGMLTNIKNMEA
jgi:hypothetical protein